MSDRLTNPQKRLLKEIREAGVLYIRRQSRYHRTVQALARRGLAHVAEPDYSRLMQDGWSVTEEAGDGA